MKKTLINITVLSLLSTIVFSQKLAIAENFAEKSISKTLLKGQNTHLYCGTAEAYEKDREAMEYFAEHPELRSNIKKSPNGWNFNVGDTHNWWVSGSGNEYYQLPSTCRQISDDCYVFVADSMWHDGGYNGVVSQADVDDISQHFSDVTANFPNEGIYDVDVRTFGDPPDVDNDHRIIILVLDIHQANVGGYFAPINEYPDDPSGFRSNEAEMFFADYSGINNSAYFRGLLAHEFQHMIHFNNDVGEIVFVNEGLSMTAEYVCGYFEESSYNLYQENTNIYLFRWDDSDHPNFSANYSRTALWTLYLYEQYPNDFLKILGQEQEDGPDGINLAITTHGGTRTWQEVLEDWLIANYLQDETINPKWGYNYQNVNMPTPIIEHTTANVNVTGGVWRASGQYVTFKTSIPDTITFTYDSDDIKIKVIKIGDTKTVEDVPKDVPYIIKPNGETYTDVTFCVINLNNSPYAIYADEYSYEASGTDTAIQPGNYEIFYEDGTDNGYLAFNEGDSLAVWFGGIAGGKLDSIKTIFQGTGRIKFDISKIGSDFLRGEPLMAQRMFNIINPTTDWILKDLTALNIDASEDFVVSFVLGADPENPTLRVSPEPDDNENHSRTYTSNGGTTQWWIFHDGGTPQLYYNYMLRAYVSVGGGTVAIDQSGIVTIPNEFSLEQNYPNPFNPSTTFGFSTPNDGLVNFTVHDLLGRVVYSENRNLLAGNYSFTWDGQNQLDQQVVSGVYFLRMESEGFTQTRKMLMMK